VIPFIKFFYNISLLIKKQEIIMDPSDDLTSMTTILNRLRDQGYGEDFQMSDRV
jgi:hypothetical protein